MKPDQDSIIAPKEMSLKRLLQYFNRNTQSSQSEKRFCFIIGSGASVASGIPTGGALVRLWVEELKKELDETELQEWLESVGYVEERAAEFYPQVYEKKFEIDPEEGYYELARLMERVEPSCGYSVLVQILANTPHNVVITTNFDTLTEDAMSSYTDKKPLVCGHESLSGFIKPFANRPIVAKIHRDLFFSPKSRSGDITKLDEQWVKSLKNIFDYYTPIVIGYGGNDGSLMGFLEELQLKGIFWCYRKADAKPNARISKLVVSHNGFLVPIEDFDEMMLQLNMQLGYDLLDKQILEVAHRKASNYQQQIVTIQNRQKSGKNTNEASAKTIRSHEGIKTWRDYELLIRNEKEAEKQNQLYLEAVNTFPNSVHLLNTYAVFLEKIYKNYDKAEEYYRKATEIAPNDSTALNNYAMLLRSVQEDYDKAEEYYKRAIEADPNNANALNNYAVLLDDIRKDYDKAEEYYKRAIEIDPNNANALYNYADLFEKVHKDYDKAEEYYKRAIEADPTDPSSLYNYATLLEDIREDYDKAEEYYKKAIEIAPNDSTALNNYAMLLRDIREDYDQAEEYYKRAIEIDPNNANALYNYADFFEKVHKNYDKAEEYYKKAIEVDPNNANALNNYAVLLEDIHKDYDKAEEYYKRAIGADPSDSTALNNYAIFLENVRNAYEKAEECYEKAIEIDPSHITALHNYAVFLSDVRGDDNKAEEYFKRAIEIDPSCITA